MYVCDKVSNLHPKCLPTATSSVSNLTLSPLPHTCTVNSNAVGGHVLETVAIATNGIQLPQWLALIQQLVQLDLRRTNNNVHRQQLGGTTTDIDRRLHRYFASSFALPGY